MLNNLFIIPTYYEHVHMHVRNTIANKEFKFVCNYIRLMWEDQWWYTFQESINYIQASKVCHGYVSYTENNAS